MFCNGFLMRSTRFELTRKHTQGFGENKITLLLPGIEPRFLGRPARSLVFIPDLDWLFF